MAFHAFVNFGSNIKGECTEKDHKDWVMIQSYSHEITQPPSVTQLTAGGRSAEAVTHGEYCIVKLIDAASPKLFTACCQGVHIPEVTIELARAGGDSPVKYMATKLKEVLISGVSHTGDPTGDSQFPTEMIKMTYGAIELTYTKQGPDGKAAGNVAATWKVTQGAA